MSFQIEILLQAIGAGIATTGFAVALSKVLRPSFLEQKERREKSLNKLKDQIKKKIENGINLEANEIIEIGYGFNLSSKQSIFVLNQLYSEAEDKDLHVVYKKLLNEINRTEPYETFPEEVRPSLARLSIVCSESPMESDKQLLHPITKIIGEYQEMKNDHAAIKKQSRISYIIALVSFFIGVVGVILAFSGPSKSFIHAELQRSVQQIEENLIKAQPGG